MVPFAEQGANLVHGLLNLVRPRSLGEDVNRRCSAARTAAAYRSPGGSLPGNRGKSVLGYGLLSVLTLVADAAVEAVAAMDAALAEPAPWLLTRNLIVVHGAMMTSSWSWPGMFAPRGLSRPTTRKGRCGRESSCQWAIRPQTVRCTSGADQADQVRALDIVIGEEFPLA